MSDNRLQAEAIRRFHARKVRLYGPAVDLERTAREWISKYAALWRKHKQRQVLGGVR